MKKIFAIILSAFLCAQAFAQINVNAGYLNTNYRAGERGVSMSVKGNGFYAGVSTDIAIPAYAQLYFEPGLNFNLDTYKFADEYHTTQYFLSAPLRVKYVQPVSFGNVFLGAGPTLICTLGAKSVSNYGGITYTENESGGKFDVALGVEGGVALTNSLKLVVGYDFGLINQNEDKDYRVTRNLLHVGFGFSF